MPLVWGQCETKCQTISSLLSFCSLPPISSAWDTSDKTRRNITGLPSGYGFNVGPTTYTIANLSQAECFCTDARTEYMPCAECRHIEWLNDNLTDDERGIMRNILSDCRSFGYYVNSILAYPSTTRSSMPFPTQTALEDEVRASCKDICDVLRGQIEVCDLTALDAEEWPVPTSLPSGEVTEYSGSVLFNRTAAECMCTLPVLRRLAGCRSCIGRELEPDLQLRMIARVENYGYDCNEMGYWTDSESEWAVWIPEEEDDPEGTPTSAASSPTPSTGVMAARFNLIGVILALSFSISLLLLF